jgi:L-lactate dehydrogenase complex protein LldE
LSTCSACELAQPLIDTLADSEHVVVPSGSCAGMLVKHYPELFQDDPL